jgi:phage terminase Nu1 subunit (DNA packaging protein)
MLTATAIARHVGKPERTIRDWLNKGIIPRTPDLSVAVQAVFAHVEKQAEESNRRRGKADEQELLEEKIRLTRAQADKVRLENQEREGELIESRQVVLAWSGYLLACRSRLLSMPTKLAYDLSGVTEPALVERILAEVVDEALLELGGEDFVDRLATAEGDDISISTPA